MMKVVNEDKNGQGFLEKIYIPEIIRGLLVTSRHFFKNILNIKQVPTIYYPEERTEIKWGLSPRLRGRHRLPCKDDGMPRCTACMLCATACPAHCIYIEPTETSDPTVEKYPVVFVIDELRCVFCGLCVEACPCDAIRMDSGIYALAEYSRAEFIYEKDVLMATERGYKE
jgi:NADH-quinone oxidoreductase subunit I